MILDWLRRQWDHLRGRRHGDWMWCASGEHLHPLDPDPKRIRVADLARGQATECRYAGHIRLDAPYPFYSVAEHSVMVSRFAGLLAIDRGFSDADVLEAKRWGLNHDSEEGYVGDMIRPLKYQPEMREFRRAGKRVDKAVREALQLRPSRAVEDLIEEIDSRILTDEIEQVIAFPDMDRVEKKFGARLGAVVRFLPPHQAEDEWLAEYTALEFERAARRAKAA